MSGEPATLDPASVTDSFSGEVMRDLYEGLTRESSNGDTVAGIASSWSVDESGRIYRFHLRADAQWSNGKRVTAQHFVSAWHRLVDPKQASPNADLLRIIEGTTAILQGKAAVESLGVSALSDRELEVRLAQPAPYFPALVSHVALAPIYSDESARAHAAERLVTDGPYVLTSWAPGARISLSRNAHYWERSGVSIPEVQYLFASDEQSQYARYRTGALELTDSLPVGALPELQKKQPQEVLIAPFLGTVYYGLNMNNGPLASRRQARQALAMAIDRKRIVALLGFGQAPAFGLVPPGTANYLPQLFNWAKLPDGERISRARSLYEAAGFSGHSPLKLRLIYNSNPVIRQTAVATAAMWHEVLGVDVELEDEEYRVFLETRHDLSRWEVARLAWAADYNDAGSFLDTLRSGSVNNDERYANPSFDALLDQAAQARGLPARAERLEAAERLMLEDCPIVPLYHFVSKRLVKPSLQGVQANPLNHIPSRDLALRAP